MNWTYRIVRNNQERYSIREVFYNQDNKIVNYSKAPVAVVNASVQELMQLVQWFREAFDLPVLSLEDIDNEISTQPKSQKSDRSKNISLKQVIAELSTDIDVVSLPKAPTPYSYVSYYLIYFNRCKCSVTTRN